MDQPILIYKERKTLPQSNSVSCQRVKFAVKFLITRGFSSAQIAREADIELADLFDAYCGKFCRKYVLVNIRKFICEVAS